jgi:hypothetical protein
MPVLLIADAELSGEADVEMADNMTRLIRGQGLYLPMRGPLRRIHGDVLAGQTRGQVIRS